MNIKKPINKNLIKANEYIPEIEIVDKDSFSKFIKEKRDYKGISTRELSNLLNIDYEMFRKMINKQKPVQKRDFFIAIGIVLDMNLDDIDSALRYYDYLPPINLDDPREDFIYNYLYDIQQQGKTTTIKQVDALLKQKGFKPLDITNQRSKKTSAASNSSNSKYRIRKYKIETPIESEEYWGDQYNSLATIYDPNERINCNGYLYLESTQNKDDVILKVISNSYGSINARTNETTFYKTEEESKELYPFFLDLDAALLKEKRRMLNTLDDTRNYKNRISANLIDDHICVFLEEYNYLMPDFNEYYLIKYNPESCALYIYNQSAFMSYYLKQNQYEQTFGRKAPVPIKKYESVEEIEKLINQSKISKHQQALLEIRKKAFKKLKPTAEEFYNKIQRREIFIQNFDYIFDNPTEVLRYYNATDIFECMTDEYEEINHYNEPATYHLGNDRVELFFNDIKKGFELGFESLHDIASYKLKYGTLDHAIS